MVLEKTGLKSTFIQGERLIRFIQIIGKNKLHGDNPLMLNFESENVFLLIIKI